MAALASIDSILSKIADSILNPLILLMAAAALVLFLWGVFEFIRDSANEEGRAKGGKNIMWGLIGLFIMLSVYGILKMLLNTFGISSPVGL